MLSFTVVPPSAVRLDSVSVLASTDFIRKVKFGKEPF